MVIDTTVPPDDDNPLLPVLRNENLGVWGRIASFSSKKTQCALSLVHRQLTGVARRHIFRRLILDIEAYESDDDTLLDRKYTDRMAKTIQRLEGIVLAGFAAQVRTFQVIGASALMKSLSLHGSDGQSHCDLTYAIFYRSVMPSFFETLGQCTGLTTLWLEHVELDISTHAAFASLRNLVNLIMRNVLLVAPLNPSIQYRLSFLELSDIMLPAKWQGENPLSPDFCAPQALKQLLLEDLEDSFFLTSLGVLNTISPNGGEEFTHLSLLEVTIDKMEISFFLPLLSSCPSLRTLELQTSPREKDFIGNDLVEDYEIEVDALPSDACPRLYSFSGPFNVAKVIIPGRPIAYLHIWDDGMSGIHRTFEEIEELLDNLTGNSVMSFKYDGCQTSKARRLLRYACERFPDLEELRILVYDYKDDVIPSYEECCNWQMRVDDSKFEDTDDMDEDSDSYPLRSRDTGELNIDEHNDEGYLRLLAEVATGLIDRSYPLRSIGTGELNIDEHYGEGFLRLLAEVATGIIKVPDTLEDLEIVQSRLFKRQKYTKAHERALIAEIERNPLCNNLIDLHMGIVGTTSNWYGRDEEVEGGPLYQKDGPPDSSHGSHADDLDL